MTKMCHFQTHRSSGNQSMGGWLVEQLRIHAVQSNQPGFESRACHSPAAWFGASDSVSLDLCPSAHRGDSGPSPQTPAGRCWIIHSYFDHYGMMIITINKLRHTKSRNYVTGEIVHFGWITESPSDFLINWGLSINYRLTGPYANFQIKGISGL